MQTGPEKACCVGFSTPDYNEHSNFALFRKHDGYFCHLYAFSFFIMYCSVSFLQVKVAFVFASLSLM